ncbi:MAG: hypothetical protein ALECFALPRED_009131 [Alectoria fallacina]|uniref:CRAL-TRIO domain-containing protein n=1 Tax=Alectoria fallacina TaxID=1903189 RepID=A0A8H3EWC9_9LECA|nr:MAG: hypothetical protein ALECFALPRED_009131 [Alectoria fallacina]
MATEASASPANREKPVLLSRPSVASEHQAKAFAELKALCEKDKLYWPASEIEGYPTQGHNEDSNLLRFLVARSYDPQAAYKQYSASATWRRKVSLVQTYDNTDVQIFERLTKQPQWTGRRDKMGIPLMVYVLSEIRPEDLAQIAKEDPGLSSIFLPAEYVTNFTQRLCNRVQNDGIVINKSVNIVDLSNVGLRKFWNLRSLLQTASSMATAHYPETVERIFVVGAPYFFPTIWSLVTRWFDPATTKKIFVLSASEATKKLTEFIAPENLPQRFGGMLDWTFPMCPVPDAETTEIIGNLADKWVEGPIRYLSKPEGDVLVAVGSQDGQLRRETLTQIPQVSSSLNGQPSEPTPTT